VVVRIPSIDVVDEEPSSMATGVEKDSASLVGCEDSIVSAVVRLSMVDVPVVVNPPSTADVEVLESAVVVPGFARSSALGEFSCLTIGVVTASSSPSSGFGSSVCSSMEIFPSAFRISIKEESDDVVVGEASSIELGVVWKGSSSSVGERRGTSARVGTARVVVSSGGRVKRSALKGLLFPSAVTEVSSAEGCEVLEFSEIRCTPPSASDSSLCGKEVELTSA